MKTQKMGPAGHPVSSSECASARVVDGVVQHSSAPMISAPSNGEQTARSMETFTGLQTSAKRHALRAAIKIRRRILFVNLDDVVSVQAQGKCVWLQRNASSYLLRESISVLAEALKTHGFIRIHRSVLVNTSFVEEISPLSTGEYCLRVEGGKEYTVTRAYKKNLKFLAELWIGAGRFFTS